MNIVRWITASGPFWAVLLWVNIATAQWTPVWQAGAPGRQWPTDGVGGGPDVDFVQEAGTNPPPGDPNSPAVNQQADDDYYFAGTYPDPIGTVAQDEIAFERAFAGTDNDLRIHFNLPDNLNPGDRFRFSYEPINLHEDAATVPDPRYGAEVFFNGTLIMPEMVFRPADLNQVVMSAEFTAADVGAIAGAGGDNVVHLRGINFGDDGGGQWMGIDYHSLETIPIPEPGSLGMMTAGLFWAVPIILSERNKRRQGR
jgi:hypothetical protein